MDRRANRRARHAFVPNDVDEVPRWALAHPHPMTPPLRRAAGGWRPAPRAAVAFPRGSLALVPAHDGERGHRTDGREPPRPPTFPKIASARWPGDATGSRRPKDQPRDVPRIDPEQRGRGSSSLSVPDQTPRTPDHHPQGPAALGRASRGAGHEDGSCEVRGFREGAAKRSGRWGRTFRRLRCSPAGCSAAPKGRPSPSSVGRCDLHHR